MGDREPENESTISLTGNRVFLCLLISTIGYFLGGILVGLADFVCLVSGFMHSATWKLGIMG